LTLAPIPNRTGADISFIADVPLALKVLSGMLVTFVRKGKRAYDKRA
jgi:hypothetical protein